MGILSDAVAVAVVAVDEDEQMARVDVNLGALVVAGGCANTALSIAVDGESVNVDHAATDAFVGLAFTPDAQRQRVAHKLVGIKAANAVAKGDGCQIDEVDKGVDLVELLALQHASDECLGGRTVARRVFSACLVDGAGGGNATHVFQRLSGQRGAIVFAKRMNFLPQRFTIGRVDHFCLDAGTDKDGADACYFVGYDDFHAAKVGIFLRKCKINLEIPSICTTFAVRMKRYTDLFIDFDDTLYDTHGNAVIALSELFDAMQLGRWFADAQLFYDEYWKANIDLWTRYSKGEITRDYLIVERFRRPLSFGEGLEPTEQLCLEASDRFLDFCSSKPGLVDGARELMDYLRGQGYRMHMCSNGFHEVQYKKLRACGLTDYFDTIVLSENAGANKPSQAFFDYALRQTGAQKETTLMIGDNLQTDILGAKRAGLDVAYFNRFPEYPATESVDYEVTSLAELMAIL